MKYVLSFLFIFACAISAQAQIKPNTVYCMKGSDAHAIDYCADLTPCKTEAGPSGPVVVCLAGAANPPAGALMSSASCWSMVSDYTCLQYSSDCTDYTSNPSCTQVGASECTQSASGTLLAAANPKLGSCASYTLSYSCKDPSKTGSTTTTTTSCSSTSIADSLSWTTASPSAAQDFVTAATSQEFARQVALYGTSSDTSVLNIFPGVAEGCTTGYGGLKNCCKSSGGSAKSNRSLMATITGEVAMAAGAAAFSAGASYAVKAGSAYVFDTIYENVPFFMGPGLSAMLGNGMMTGSLSSTAANLASTAGGAVSNAMDAADAAASAAQAAADAASTAAGAAAASAASGTAEAAASAAFAQAQAAAAAATAAAATQAANVAQAAATNASNASAAASSGGFALFGFGSSASSAAGMFASSTSSMDLGSALFGTGAADMLYFNPYALAASIAIQVVMDAVSCSKAEIDLANAKRQNLCHYVGSYCSNQLKVLGITLACLETKQSYCCYNGLLGIAIEEGAHAQLGLSWGSAQSPNCTGLTPDQITSLDFTAPAMQAAMAPFEAQIMANVNASAGAALANGSIQTAAQSTATTNAHALCLQRQQLDPATTCN